jgi:uncharacterized membrane protein/glutaredoxin
LGKASRKKKSGPGESVQQIPLRTPPNWLLVGLALAGMALSAYLTVTAWRGRAVAGCAAGSACDAVLASHWSQLLGLPTSFWGFLAYASLAAIAFVKRADIRWKLAWTVSLFGVLYSSYLTVISIAELKAACPYCLSSLALMVAIFAVIVYRRPADAPHVSWTAWLLETVPAALLLVFALHLHYAGVWGNATPGNDPKLRALAEHLAKSGAIFYGASWCPHCKEQKELFGAAADRLPYVECSPQGPRAPQAPVCETLEIKGYPTWIIDGRRYEGLLMPEELEKYSGFERSSR